MTRTTQRAGVRPSKRDHRSALGRADSRPAPRPSRRDAEAAINVGRGSATARYLKGVGERVPNLLEWTKAVRNLGLAARHPSWLVAFMRAGRKDVLRELVKLSLVQVRSVPSPRDLPSIVAQPPVSFLGRIGARQEYLYFLVRLKRPEVVVETGVHRGISTAFILAGLRDNACGRLVSIDLPSATYSAPGRRRPVLSPLQGSEQTGYAVPEELRDRWTLKVGDTRELLPDLLNELGRIDLFYHDSEHTYGCMRFEYEAARVHLIDGGVLASDDVGWNRAFREFSSHPSVTWSGVVGGELGVAELGRSEDRAS